MGIKQLIYAKPIVSTNFFFFLSQYPILSSEKGTLSVRNYISMEEQWKDPLGRYTYPMFL